MEESLHEQAQRKADSIFFGKRVTRLVAALADSFFVTLLGVLLAVLPFYYFLGYYGDVGCYLTHQNSLNEKAISSHLVSKNDNGSFKSDDDLAYEYVLVQAKKDFYDADGVRKDRIAYYYLDYKGETISFLNDLMYKAQGSDLLFETKDAEKGILPLREDVSEGILAYVSGHSSNKESFNKVSKVFEKLYTDAKDDFSKEPDYLSEFQQMNAVYETMEWKGSLSAFLGYLLAGALLFVLLPVFAFNGNTIGKKILKLCVLDEYGAPLTKWKSALRGFLVFVTELFIPFIIAYVANWGVASLNLPVFKVGSFTLTMGAFVLFFFALSLVSIITLLIRKDRRSLHDLALRSGVYTTDLKRIEEEKRIRDYHLKSSGENNGNRL